MFSKSNKHRLGSSNQLQVQRSIEYDVICTELLSKQKCYCVNPDETILHNCEESVAITEPVIESETNVLEQTLVAEKIMSIENVITVTKLRNKMLRKNSW